MRVAVGMTLLSAAVALAACNGLTGLEDRDFLEEPETDAGSSDGSSDAPSDAPRDAPACTTNACGGCTKKPACATFCIERPARDCGLPVYCEEQDFRG